MDFAEYERSGRNRYVDYAETVARILDLTVRSDGSFRLEQVQHRAKNPESLKKKLAGRGVLKSQDIGSEVKDLAGCRVLFYTNADVNRFTSTGLLTDNFDIDWDGMKVHYPKGAAVGAAEHFVSFNYPVRLKEQRLALPEYARFRGMICEVQVQTTLNHAWAEMAHDTIYKGPELSGFGKGQMEAIEARMKKIMREHLLPAGYEFQKVLYDFDRLASGKELFDRGVLEELARTPDNNARHDLLERFSDYVLPHYDDVRGVYPEIRLALVETVRHARTQPTTLIETPFGKLPGHSAEDVLEQVADVLERLRYVDVKGTFDALCELYPGGSDKEKERLLHVAERLARHELGVWKQHGPAVQHWLLQIIRELEPAVSVEVRPLIIEVLHQVLSLEIEGTSSTYDAITLHRAAVRVSGALSETRTGAIDYLIHLFETATSDVERRKIVQALNEATRLPYQADYKDELLASTLVEGKRIVDAYTARAKGISFELLQKLEHDLLWLYRHRVSATAIEAAEQHAPEREALRASIITFRDVVNGFPEFVTYKTLVGYEAVFLPEWESHGFELEAEREYRSAQVDELVAGVTEANADEWFATLDQCAATDSDDLATFPSLIEFLKKLGARNPIVVLERLDGLGPKLRQFLPSILRGLDASVPEQVSTYVSALVDRGDDLSGIALYLHDGAASSPELLQRLMQAALNANDDVAALNAIGAASTRCEAGVQGLAETILLPAVRYFAGKEDTRWIFSLWPHPKKDSLLRELTREQATEVLNALVVLPDIGYRQEEVLAAIAERYPREVIDYFGARLGRKEDEAPGARYEPVPYDFHVLHEQLAPEGDYLLGCARGWFPHDEMLFPYRGGRLLTGVFPELGPQLEGSLRELIARGEEENIRFVLRVLRGYNEGGSFLQPMCKALVEALPSGDSLLDEIAVILGTTGVVAGEFGFVEAYQSQAAAMRPWVQDSNAKVREFADRRIKSLERTIAAEQRRAEESLELRKREYGESSAD